MNVLSLFASATAAAIVASATPSEEPPPSRPAQCVDTPLGDVACGWNCVTGESGDVKCAQHPDGVCKAAPAGHVVCSSALHLVRQRWNPKSRATCKQGALGQVACGWACADGDDGSVRCASSPDGACAKSAAGSVTCFSNAMLVIELPSNLPKAQCDTSEAGDVVCGYDCKTGASGAIRCANTPDGACALDALGDVVCTTLDPTRRIVVTRKPKKDAAPAR